MTHVSPTYQSKPRLLRERLVYPSLIVAGSIAIAVFLVLSAPQTRGGSNEQVAALVRSVVVEPQDVRLHVGSQGTIEPRTEANLISEVSGRIEWIAPAMVSGGRFERDDILVRLDTRDYKNALNGASAAMQRAEAEYAFARSENERISSLLERELASQSQAQNAQRAFEVAASNRLEASAALDRAQLEVARTEIRAPFTGRVRSEQVDVGQFVQRGGAIATLYATDYVEVRLPIADTQLAYLDPELVRSGIASGSERPAVTLSARYAGQAHEWHGWLDRTEGEIDVRSRMVHVVARVPNPEGSDSPLPVGLFVKAEIDGVLAPNAVRLPRSALRDSNRLLVIDENTRLHFREVDIIRFERDEVVIGDGLAAGERVCISPLQAVVEGMQVSLYTDGE